MSKFQLPSFEQMMFAFADNPLFQAIPGEKIRYEAEGNILLTYLNADKQVVEMCLETGGATEEEAIGGLVNKYVKDYAKIDDVIHRLVEIFRINISADEVSKSIYEYDGGVWYRYTIPGGRIYHLNAWAYFVEELDLCNALERYVVFGDASLLHEKGVYVYRNNGADSLTLLFADGLIESLVSCGDVLRKYQDQEFKPESLAEAESLLKAAERTHVGIPKIKQETWREKALSDLQELQAKQRVENIKQILVDK